MKNSSLKTTVAQDHPFAQYVRILGKGKTGSRALSQEEAHQAFTMILNGQVEDVQLGAFLMLLRVKEETAEELAGFVQACRETMIKPDQVLSVDLDWSSYAGKKKQYPWYLLSALLLAQQGIKIFMHGAAGHTEGRIYTEQVLPALGFANAENWQQAEQQLQERSFTYMPLDKFSPQLSDIIKLRPLMGLRSPVHTLSRLLNPTGAAHSLQSIFHPAYGPNHQAAAALLQQPNAMVFKGEGGEVERRPEANTTSHLLRNGVSEEQLWPRQLEGRQPIVSDFSIEHMQQVWRGTAEDQYAEAATIGTTAFALSLMNPEKSPAEAMKLAESYWQQRDTNLL